LSRIGVDNPYRAAILSKKVEANRQNRQRRIYMWDFLGQAALSCWELLVDMAPYVLLGFLAAGILSVWLPKDLVERHLGGGRRFGPVLKAALIGIPIPLCCCGVIPLAASLRRQGAGRGATTAFLISTPQTGVDSILVTYSLLGPVFAILRPVTALFSGLLGGFLVALGGSKKPSNEAKIQFPAISQDSKTISDADCGCGCSCGTSPKPASKIQGILSYGFLELPQDLAKPFIIGLGAAGLLAAFLPPYFFEEFMGHGLLSMLIMLVVGAPLYICATAAVPLAAAFLAKGLSPGAVLVFLMAAPATNLATMILVWKIMGPRTLLSYILAVAVTALGAGYLTDLFLRVSALSGAKAAFEEVPGLVNHVMAFALVGLLIVGLWRSLRAPAQQNTYGAA
jgi:uncharacterized protein